uniref:hypothetical protein n=1 Tax=Aliarcobacter sp. TaxID=2321116 RepID=UPI004047EA2D
MLKVSKYINVLILLSLILLVLSFDSFKSISTQLTTILPKSEQKDLLREFNKFQSSKKIFLSIKGLDKDSLTEIKRIEEQLVKIDGLAIQKPKTNKEFEKYKNEYKFFINDFKNTSLENFDTNKNLEKLKTDIYNSNFSYFIDKKDPFNLLEKPISNQTFSLKNGHLIIKDYGYLLLFNIDNSINSLKKYEKIYDSIQRITTSNENIKVFSPIFYFVENSRIIKEDVNKIILFSTVVLLLLYLVILRNLKLLINTLITLSSSILLALLITSLLFDKISIFVIVFGISISTVAIDYMFHHYVHKYYEKEKTFNKEVFLGMFTTIGAFFIISFISFDLIKQISYFAIISLVFSYIQFSFLFPKIGFSQKQNLNDKIYKSYTKLNPKIVIFFSIILALISFSQIKFDSNLKNLDVNNTKLKEIENSFNTSLNLQQNIPVLIKAKSIDELIKNARILKTNFPNSNIPFAMLINEEDFEKKKEFLEKSNLNKINLLINEKALSFGFKENFFKEAYTYKIEKPNYTIEKLEKFNLEVLFYDNYFITYANLPQDKKLEFYKYDFVQTLSIKDMFENNLISIYNELIFYGILTILFIISMVLLSTKRNYLISFTYILFPLSMILTLSLFLEFNILHLFMLFILLSISIDFGIYMGSKNINKNSYKAVIYSLLSTFAGFGVLVFSQINALFSIGIIATIGIIAITILLIFLKRPSYDSKNI